MCNDTKKTLIIMSLAPQDPCMLFDHTRDIIVDTIITVMVEYITFYTHWYIYYT